VASSWIYWTRTWTTHEEYLVVELLCAERRKMYARCLIVILVLLALAQILPRGVEACPKPRSKPRPKPQPKVRGITGTYLKRHGCENGEDRLGLPSCCEWCDRYGTRESCKCKRELQSKVPLRYYYKCLCQYYLRT